MNRTINDAEGWFKLQDIPTVQKDDTILVVCGDGFELELSRDEVAFRAQLYRDFVNSIGENSIG